jgi:hypothetical protein
MLSCVQAGLLGVRMLCFRWKEPFCRRLMRLEVYIASCQAAYAELVLLTEGVHG